MRVVEDYRIIPAQRIYIACIGTLKSLRREKHYDDDEMIKHYVKVDEF